jgi:hypothetical protein
LAPGPHRLRLVLADGGGGTIVAAEELVIVVPGTGDVAPAAPGDEGAAGR